jgi:hypothetical protein
MQSFTFVINNISGSVNKVVYSLSKRNLILKEFEVGTLVFEHLKEMYQGDPDFKESNEACENPFLRDIN